MTNIIFQYNASAASGATSCVASPSLPNGLNIDSSTCTISGTPTVATTNTSYNVTAVIGGTTFQTAVWFSTSYLELTPSVEGAELNLDEAMTNITFQYNSSAASGSGTTTNGNGTVWQVADIFSGTGSSGPGDNMEILVGDTLYFDAGGVSGHSNELWAHDTSNASTWRVADINSGTDGSFPGEYMAILVGDTIYFSADDGSSGDELWAHDTSNASTWRVADINSGAGSSNPGTNMEILVGDTLYFDAYDANSGKELWAHDTSNASTWRVTDINSGTGSSNPGYNGLEISVGDTLYFSANDGSSGNELWAHDTTNASTWQVADIHSGGSSSSSDPGDNMAILVGDTLYFNANEGHAAPNRGRELWAHDTSNASTWLAADISPNLPSGTVGSSNPGYNGLEISVGDTLYFSADEWGSGRELWAHDTSNASTWRVAYIRSGTDDSNPGFHMESLVGDTLYFDADDGSSGKELWAHDTSNASTWKVADISSGGTYSSSYPGQFLESLVGDTLYFSADDGSSGHELWAHDTSNASTWQVADIYSGGTSGSNGAIMGILVGDTLYFSARDGSSGYELWAHQPGEITSLSSGSGSGGSGGGSSSSSSSVYANNKVSVGYSHTCAILDNGDLKCWGSDQYGQLGDGGSNTNTNAPSSTPIDLGSGRTAVAVSAGDLHTCAILDNGDLKCWGRDTTDSWAMVEATPTPTHLHPQRSTSARAERPLQCLLETPHLRHP